MHVDRNSYSGGECVSPNMEQLMETFGKGAADPSLGRPHLWNVGPCPNLLKANGILVKILRNAVAAGYNMEFTLTEVTARFTKCL